LPVIFDLLASLFLFERHGYISVGREANLLSDSSNEAERNVMVMVLMAATEAGTARILLGQFDAVAFDLFDGADVDTVGADDFHILADVLVHGVVPVTVAES
jgi:hypothetical protein